MHRRILVVDDEPKNIKLLQTILISERYEVETAANGKEALDKIRLKYPDLILLDVMMPEMDGYEVCRRIRSDGSLPYSPIIFLTAMHLDRNDMIHGLDVGGDDYIRKPFDTSELLARIRAALRFKELYQELTRTKAELSRYVSQSTLEMVNKATSGEIIQAGELMEVTVLFSDIRGFTSIVENMAPSEVFQMLNYYLSLQIKVVEDHHGIIDKLSGDEVMAFFYGPDMVNDTLECATAIVKALCSSGSCQGSQWIGVGIGINTGPAFMGILGTQTRKHYTGIGTTVNVAARLCGLAKKFQILFSETTRKAIRGKPDVFQSIGKVSLKGISEPIEAFELL